MKSGIYLIVNVTNNKVYVGSSKSLKARRYTHIRDLKRGKHVNPHLQHAWNECGAEAFHFSVLEYCDVGDLLEREDWWIVLLGSRDRSRGYNLWSARRHECSPETRAKLSEANKRNGHRPPPNWGNAWNVGKKLPEAQVEQLREKWTGEKNPNYGKPHSAEHRAKLSEAAKRRVSTPEGRAQLEATLAKCHSSEAVAKASEKKRGIEPWNKGIPASEETRSRISASSKGRVCTEETRAKRSAALSGERNPNYGKAMSKEQRLKLSEAAKRRLAEPEEKARMEKVIAKARLSRWPKAEAA